MERTWTPDMFDEMARLRGIGVSFAKIAQRLGVTRGDAIEKALRMGLRVRVVLECVAVMSAEPEPIGPVREILGRGVCHWIAGEGAWRMCGHKAVRNTHWCAHHFSRAYRSVAVVRASKRKAV